jgi:hypothetical protein
MKVGASVAQPRRTTAAAAGLDGRSWDWGRLSTPAFLLAIAVGIWWAWSRRADPLLTPDKGAGYAIGLTGALMMLALLLYPLRKRARFMRSWGPAAVWFRWHMILGVLGPALIIIHSDFELQSTNATVALVSMLTVAGSGLAGRYLYGRVHRGLYGRRLEAKALRDEAIGSRNHLGGVLAGSAGWNDELSAFEVTALAPTTTLGAALTRALSIGGLARRSRRTVTDQIEGELKRAARAHGWDDRTLRLRRSEANARLATYYAAVKRAATLGVYERLFALWHVLHVPLFIILVLTAIIHVVAVHLY